LGPTTINALADKLVMDRTTLGRNNLPLEREGLISITPGRDDRRSKELQVTSAGVERLRVARKGWSTAQTQFATAFGEERTARLRTLLRAVSATEFPATTSKMSGLEAHQPASR
jgi:DNA-binding MarR family transcriptional regulator